MASVEGFRDVGGGEFDQNSLASFRGIFRVSKAQEFVLSEGLFSSEDRRDEDFGELVDFEEELEECTGYCWLVDERRLGELEESNELARITGQWGKIEHTFSTHSAASSGGFLPLTRNAGTGRTKSPFSSVCVH